MTEKKDSAELCRKEGINQNLYYRWSKEFLEAGKKRLAGDTAREANSDEVKGLRREAAQLKEALARVVEFFCRPDYVVPYPFICRIAWLVIQGRINVALGELGGQLLGSVQGGFTPCIESLMVSSALFGRQDIRGSGKDVSDCPHSVGMICDHLEVKWLSQFYGLPRVGDHLFTPGEAVGITGHERCATTSGIGQGLLRWLVVRS